MSTLCRRLRVTITSIGGEARTFDVELQAVAARIADRRATSVAGAFSPATADLVLVVGRKLTGKIEIITVTGATKLQIDFALAAAARAVIGDATDTLGSAVLRSRTVPAPDQLPVKSANGPEAADAGRSGIETAETRATSQQPKRAAGENTDKRSNVRCKVELPVEFCSGEQDNSSAIPQIWCLRLLNELPNRGFSLKFVSPTATGRH